VRVQVTDSAAYLGKAVGALAAAQRDAVNPLLAQLPQASQAKLQTLVEAGASQPALS
jgi:hypothetical protein